MRWLRCGALVLAVILFRALLVAAPPNSQEIVDSVEPDAMLAFLDTCAKGPAPAAQITQILNLPGAKLLFKELNRLSLVTEEQYRSTLDAACQGKIANVPPSERSERSRTGVRLLKEEIAPALIWGKGNVSALQARLQQLRRDGGIGRTAAVAEKNLPEKVILTPRYYFVMGGPVEAAAIDNEIYIDILQSLWRASRRQLVFSPHDVLVFFADEAHHAGYQKILDKKRDTLSLSPGELQAWNLLSRVVVQGSATFLIDANEKPDDVRNLAALKPQWKHSAKLLAELQKLLTASLQEAGTTTASGHAKVGKVFSETDYDVIGAVLLSAIEKERGRDGVMETMADPRKLLSVYNDCAGSSAVKFRFSAWLAQRTVTIGSAATK